VASVSDQKSALLALAGALVSSGVAVLVSTDRTVLGWFLVVGGAVVFGWLFAPPYVLDRRARVARREAEIQQGRANQRQGLDEIANELGQISSQLKQELRWGKRTWGLFPNTAWAKNQHLVTQEGGVRAAVDSAYEQGA
jgi:hypothetical protein